MIFDMVRFLKKRPIIHLMVVLTLALLCQGCGKTGDPMPPDVAMSERVADLAVRPEKEGALLNWSITGKGVGSKASNTAEIEFKKKG